MDPAAFPPMLLEERKAPLDSAEWAAEIKHDGYRLTAGTGPDGVRLRSRNGADATKWFPEIAQALAGLGGNGAVLDGEVCVLDEIGRSDFVKLHERARRRRFVPELPVVYCVFDVMAWGGRDITTKPLTARRTHLEALRGLPSVLVVEQFVGKGAWLYKQALSLKLEGIVAKRLDSPYRPGIRSADWVKIKRPGAVPAQRFERGRHL